MMAGKNSGSDRVEDDLLEFVLDFLDDDFELIEGEEQVSIEEVIKLSYVILNCVAQQQRYYLSIWRFHL